MDARFHGVLYLIGLPGQVKNRNSEHDHCDCHCDGQPFHGHQYTPRTESLPGLAPDRVGDELAGAAWRRHGETGRVSHFPFTRESPEKPLEDSKVVTRIPWVPAITLASSGIQTTRPRREH